MTRFPKPERRPKKRKAVRKKTSARKMKQALDLIVREQVFDRDERKCVAYGQANVRCRSDILQAAHVLPKGKYGRLRFEPENILTLCFFHHMIWAHKDPLAFAAWFRETYPGREEKLREMAQTAGKLNLRELWEARRGEKE